ncbi:MAG: chromosome segregation protein SMC [Thermomicrobiales bacterium]
MTDAPVLPRLTRLDLHGFKSFAVKTVFTFEPGITAVIGPNGSGKSNIADAVRWVLGEQSHGALRSKKTEDVIFAGGTGRAPSGMAEVAVTFDNSTNWLPIAFSEVTVARRAYRGGENHYLINGRRVRLKDVTHLTASLGQSHTVVGQGLVDAALSQRADERRALFEHAADLTGLRLKAAEAERSLNEAEANSARLTDLLSEIEPRLKTLERAARQATEWKGLHDRLRELQRAHYGALLAQVARRLDAAEAAASGDEVALARRRDEVEWLAGDLARARAAAEDARAALAQHAARLQATIDQERRVGHERDLAAERHTALTRRREDMADTQAGLDEQTAVVQRDLASVGDDLRAAETEVTQARQAVAAMQREGTSVRAARQEREGHANRLRVAIADAERTLADVARRRALREQRRETDAAERDRAARERAERADRIEHLTGELTTFDRAEEAGTVELAAFDERLAALATEIETANAAVAAARQRVAEAERNLDGAKTRFEVLQRLHESGAGLFTGVRAVLHAARDGALTGITGMVAELIDVPAAYDTAVEVALGGHVQDVVVARWTDAEAAIAHLQRARAGRATFQPLDTVKASRERGLPAKILRMPGVHGIAADLIAAPDEIAPVVAALLGRTLIVDDLPVTRQALPHLPPGWSVVTIGGEIARTGGSVTGGAAVRESGVLGRERELRELPKEIRGLDRARTEAVAKLDEMIDTPRRLATERQEVDSARAGLLAARKERQGQRDRLTGWLADLRTEQEAADRRLATLADADVTGERDLAALDREATTATTTFDKTHAEHAVLQRDLARDAAAIAAAEQTLAAEHRRLAALEERLRSERRREAGLLAQQRALADELALRMQRAAALDGELLAVAAQRERLVKEVETVSVARQAVARERPPLEAAVRQTEGDVSRLDRSLEAARTALLEAERAHGARGLDVERARGELATIRQRIADDLELDDPNMLMAGADPDAPLDPRAEREIQRLRERLRRVGYVGEDVVGEYEREAERLGFLRTQLADVEGASASLRGLLVDLHRQMRERFDATFARVAEVFTEMFTALFGGGTARLVMVAPDDGEERTEAGIDIVAQPPGKRLQSLALLSGGERALTAVALLFAILKVNPTPFCLLDEVDAALDEANIVLFRDQLRALAAEAQAIIITHNRGTIEIADTLYGVSMRDDGVSQVLSLRLEEAVVG